MIVSWKRYFVQWMPLLSSLFAVNALAIEHYVDLNSTNATPPFTNWITAATNIQDAVDAALAGDEIVVTNGVYSTGGRAVGTNLLVNRVVVDRPITLRSVNGAAFTIIQGYQVPGTTNGDGAVRCVYLANGARLFGFALTNGATRAVEDAYSFRESGGGGVYCASSSSVVSNCVLVGNSAHNDGGGVLSGTLANCSLIRNSAKYGGGANNASLNNCTLSGNWTTRYDGGGAFGSTLYNCTLTGNSAAQVGGGAGLVTLNNCVLSSNSAAQQGGGVYYGTLNNCSVMSNSADRGGGASVATLVNCTLVGNKATTSGGGVADCYATNCIIYYNTAPSGSNTYFVHGMTYCCTPLAGGLGNITNAPLFADYAGGNLRPQTNSPCINAGNNLAVTNSTDLDGRSRIVGGTVDIGAYEFQGAGMGEFIAWLKQYGLPADGSADSLDSDADGMDNWKEWRCLTDPTNALSVLKLLGPTGNSSALTVSWQSVTNRSYWLERTANLAPPSFSSIASNLPGQLGTTKYTDTNAVGPGPFFYRVGVQP